jgi:hypothetical protein
MCHAVKVNKFKSDHVVLIYKGTSYLTRTMSSFLHAFLTQAGCVHPETLACLIANRIYTKEQLKKTWKQPWIAWVATLTSNGVHGEDAKKIWLWFAKEKLQTYRQRCEI